MSIIEIRRYRLIVVLMLMLVSTTTGFAQEGGISLKGKTISVGDIFESIENQSNYRLSYNRNTLDATRMLDMPGTSLTIKDALDHVVKGLVGVKYVLRGNYIALVPADDTPAPTPNISEPSAVLDRRAMEPEFAVIGMKTEQQPATTDTTFQILLLFPFDSSNIDKDFMDNDKCLAALDSFMSDRAFVSRLDSVMVMAGSSPDGNPDYNRRLALRRAEAIKSYILENYPYINSEIITAKADPRYWDGLIGMVEADPNVPGRDALLDLLREPRISDYTKNNRMTTMQDGATFAYLRDNLILRHLRSGSAVIELYTPAPEPTPELVFEPEPEPEPQPEPEPEIIVEILPAAPQYRSPVALRTNLLLDLVGGPNIGIEVPIGNRFSVAADFAYAYTRIDNRYALQTIQGTLEGRYWFNRKGNVLTGWNVGVYGTYCSRFDLQWDNGYQGNGYWSAGLSFGYSWRLSDNFNLDLSAMGGAVWISELRYYDKPQDGHLIWTETRYNATRFLPTLVRANFVWLIGAKKKVK